MYYKDQALGLVNLRGCLYQGQTESFIQACFALAEEGKEIGWEWNVVSSMLDRRP